MQLPAIQSFAGFHRLPLRGRQAEGSLPYEWCGVSNDNFSEIANSNRAINCDLTFKFPFIEVFAKSAESLASPMGEVSRSDGEGSRGSQIGTELVVRWAVNGTSIS